MKTYLNYSMTEKMIVDYVTEIMVLAYRESLQAVLRKITTLNPVSTQNRNKVFNLEFKTEQ